MRGVWTCVQLLSSSVINGIKTRTELMDSSPPAIMKKIVWIKQNHLCMKSAQVHCFGLLCLIAELSPTRLLVSFTMLSILWGSLGSKVDLRSAAGTSAWFIQLRATQQTSVFYIGLTRSSEYQIAFLWAWTATQLLWSISFSVKVWQNYLNRTLRDFLWVQLCGSCMLRLSGNGCKPRAIAELSELGACRNHTVSKRIVSASPLNVACS